MGSANEQQVGGDHYKRHDYQHWDFVTDAEVPYLIACATKYVTRWRGKNGIEDLRKAVHYLQKAEERHVDSKSLREPQAWVRFIDQHDGPEKDILGAIGNDHFVAAAALIFELIAANTEPTENSQGRRAKGRRS